MGEVVKQQGMAALALRFAILTAARTGEAIGARWTEVDISTAIWTVPAERMKAGQEHRVPLADAALTVLREAAAFSLPRDTVDPIDTLVGRDGFVFPGGKAGKGLSNMAMAMLLQRMGRDDLTVHGFRSTFRDWCAASANYPRELAEAALAHTLRDKVEAAYQRGDLMEKRRRLMAEWATFCARSSGPAEVVPLRARA
jgi:integrase